MKFKKKHSQNDVKEWNIKVRKMNKIKVNSLIIIIVTFIFAVFTIFLKNIEIILFCFSLFEIFFRLRLRLEIAVFFREIVDILSFFCSFFLLQRLLSLLSYLFSSLSQVRRRNRKSYCYQNDDYSRFFHQFRSLREINHVVVRQQCQNNDVWTI